MKSVHFALVLNQTHHHSNVQNLRNKTLDKTEVKKEGITRLAEVLVPLVLLVPLVQQMQLRCLIYDLLYRQGETKVLSRNAMSNMQSEPNQFKGKLFRGDEACRSKCVGPARPCHWIKREEDLGATQCSILTQYNPCRYCKQFHMTLQRKGCGRRLSQDYCGSRLKNTDVNCKYILFSLH